MAIGEFLGTMLFLHMLLGLTIAVPIAGVLFIIWGRKLYRSSLNGKSRSVLLAAELYFGLIQPLIYLFFIYPALWDTDLWSWQAMHALSLTIVGTVWLARCLSTGKIGFARSKTLIIATALLCITTIIGHAVMAIMVAPNVKVFGQEMLIYVVPSIHYIVPLVIAGIYLQRALKADRPEVVELFFLRHTQPDMGRSGIWPARVVAALAVFLILLPVFNRIDSPRFAARQFVENHKTSIESAAAENHIDPVTLAAVAYTAKHHTAFWKPAFERLVMGIWLADTKGHFLLSKSLDLSIGPVQIKPTTAQSALLIYGSAKHQIELRRKIETGTAKENDQYFFYDHFKEYREAWKPKDNWGLSAESLKTVRLPVEQHPDKKAVVGNLLDPEQSIRFCAFILSLYAAQWDEHVPEHSIRSNPGILGTLYQIGFQKSQPHPAPKASRFGEDVALAAEEEWIKALF